MICKYGVIVNVSNKIINSDNSSKEGTSVQWYCIFSNWDLNEARADRVLRCTGISWTICKQYAHRCRQITMLAPHHSIFTDRMLFVMSDQQCQNTEG